MTGARRRSGSRAASTTSPQGCRPQVVLANLRGMVRAAKEENLDVALADLLP